MKKGSKPLLIVSVLLTLLITQLVLTYVGLKIECEVLAREKLLKQEELNSEKNRRVRLVAELQHVSSKERIIEVAKEELGLVNRTKPLIVLNVSKDKIRKIELLIKDKYE